MFEVASKLKTYFPENQSRIEFVLYTSLRDRYGNSFEENIMTVPFSMAEIEKINFGNPNFLSFDLLNLAGEVTYSHPVGRTLYAPIALIKTISDSHRAFACPRCDNPN